MEIYHLISELKVQSKKFKEIKEENNEKNNFYLFNCRFKFTINLS
jgi:hypothetical protein